MRLRTLHRAPCSLWDGRGQKGQQGRVWHLLLVAFPQQSCWPGPPRQISLGGGDREGREKRSWIFPEFAAKSSELQSEQLRFWKALRRSKM